MTDAEQIIQVYTEMYRAMIEKDAEGLNAVLDDSFVLIHMTGMQQDKRAFIHAVCDGTLNYFSSRHEHMPVELQDDTAILTGQSVVEAAVFGGGRHIWHLQQRCLLKRTDAGWWITESTASTY